MGAISVSKNGGVYVIIIFFKKIREGKPISEFKGIEFLGTHGFGLDSLPQLYKEYKMEKCNDVFALDMRKYRKSAFNMSITILTEEGLLKLYDSWKNLKKRQLYLFTGCRPMIAIMIADAKVGAE